MKEKILSNLQIKNNAIENTIKQLILSTKNSVMKVEEVENISSIVFSLREDYIDNRFEIFKIKNFY